MKSDPIIIQHLNKILGNELVAINQYFLHARMYKDWGLKRLADKEYHESIEEMNHADRLIERILFLEGIPNLQDLGKLMIGEDTKEMIECDLKLEMTAIPDLRAAIAYAEDSNDYVSKELFQRILEDEEDHEIVLDYLNEGDFFGEMGLFDENVNRSAWVKARNQCELAEISYSKFHLVMKELPEVLFEVYPQFVVF